MKSIDKLVKSLFVAAGIGAGIMGFSAKADAQCPGPFVSDEKSEVWHFDENGGSETRSEFRGVAGVSHATIYSPYGTPSSDLWSSGMFGPSGLKFHQPSSMAIQDRGVIFQKGPGITVEAYVNPESDPLPIGQSYQCIVSQYSFKFGLDRDGKLFIAMREPSTTPPYYVDEEFHGNTRVEPGRFTYVAFTYNGGNIIDLYVNGTNDGTRYMFRSSPLPAPIGMAFGAAGVDRNKNIIAQFNGIIDEVRITDGVREDFAPCSVTTPVVPTTWGKLKSIYR